MLPEVVVGMMTDRNSCTISMLFIAIEWLVHIISSYCSCINSEKHYSLVTNENELILGSISLSGKTQLQKVTLPLLPGSQNTDETADKIELDSVTDCLVSLVKVDGLPDALLGASPTNLYIW
jgi:hypothetical protein